MSLRITRTVTIPDDEIELGFARSGGPGGQHVNTSATKVELRWDLEASPSLTDRQKDRVRKALSNRLTKDGVLVLASSEYRSQTRNREAVMARFCTLLADALKVQAQRRPTRPSRAAKRRRLEDKRHQSEKKARRQPPPAP